MDSYVLDGGSLLHRIPWPRGATFGKIIDMYAKYVRNRYSNAIVVFDGYGNGPSTKDHTPFKSKKDLFLVVETTYSVEQSPRIHKASARVDY
jgi:hypothetical protein